MLCSRHGVTSLTSLVWVSKRSAYAGDEADRAEDDADRDPADRTHRPGASSVVDDEADRRAPDDASNEKPSKAEQIAAPQLLAPVVRHAI